MIYVRRPRAVGGEEYKSSDFEGEIFLAGVGGGRGRGDPKTFLPLPEKILAGGNRLDPPPPSSGFPDFWKFWKDGDQTKNFRTLSNNFTTVRPPPSRNSPRGQTPLSGLSANPPLC